MSVYEREFSFTDRDFGNIRRLVSEHTGISLSDAKKNMVYSRLSRRLRQVGLNDFDSYLKYLKEEDAADELVQFTNAITTNLTSFFREQHHFEYLSKTLLPEVMKHNDHTGKIRIWSAGCSTGEEPYSIAMTIKETIPDSAGWDIRILATDLDSNVLETARSGIYSEERVNGIPKSMVKRWFLRGKNQHTGKIRAHPALRDMITFGQLNLMKQWPVKGPIDIIFCRNVVIYFDKPTQQVLFDRYANVLANHGHLFLGHSETMFKVKNRFELIGKTVYRKVC